MTGIRIRAAGCVNRYHGTERLREIKEHLARSIIKKLSDLE